MENNNFEELPIGFSMLLCTSKNAMKNFANLDNDTKKDIIKYITASEDGYEIKQRINKAVYYLDQNNLNFL